MLPVGIQVGDLIILPGRVGVLKRLIRDIGDDAAILISGIVLAVDRDIPVLQDVMLIAEHIHAAVYGFHAFAFDHTSAGP